MHTFLRNHFSSKLGRIITAAAGASVALILGTQIAVASTHNLATQNVASCLLQNCSFETTTSSPSVPTDWHLAGFKATSGGVDTSQHYDGAQSMWFANTGKLRKVYQDVTTSGPAGTHFTLTFWTKSNNAQINGLYRVFVIVYYGKAGSGKFYVNQPYGTYGWDQYRLTFTTAKAYTKIHVEIDFGKKGEAWFDGFELTTP